MFSLTVNGYQILSVGFCDLALILILSYYICNHRFTRMVYDRLCRTGAPWSTKGL